MGQLQYSSAYDSDRSLQLHGIRQHLFSQFPRRYKPDDIKLWKDLDKVEPKHLAQIIDEMTTDFARDMYESEFKTEIAPKELIIKDFRDMAKEAMFFLKKRQRYDMSARAIQGHAHEGHRVFANARFRNTTTLDVISALETKKFSVSKKPAFNVEDFQNRTQEWIDEIVAPMSDFFDNPEAYVSDVQLEGKRNRPFAQLGWLAGQKVNMLEVIRGFYFASQMDNFEWRRLAEQKYGITIGGGDCLPVDMKVLRRYGANLSHYASTDFPREMFPLRHLNPEIRKEVLHQLGIVVKPELKWSDVGVSEWNWNTIKDLAINVRDSPYDVSNVYVRSKIGPGVSDDIALVLASFLPPTFTRRAVRPIDAASRFIGATLADLVDTLEKDSHSIFAGGQDDAIGTYFARRFDLACKKSKKFRTLFEVNQLGADQERYELVNTPVLVDFIAASANTADVKIHSSQRYFHKDIGGTCALAEYFKLMHNVNNQYGLPFARLDATPNELLRDDVSLTFARLKSKDVYHEIGRRISLIRLPHERERKITRFYSLGAQD